MVVVGGVLTSLSIIKFYFVVGRLFPTWVVAFFVVDDVEER